MPAARSQRRMTSYQRPAATVLRFEVEHAILGDSDDEGTEPIIDDGSSHGWT